MGNSDKKEKDFKLDIEIGTKLNIKIEGIAIPITSRFIGMERPEYLLISPPAPFATIKPKLFPGNNLILQYLREGTIYVFMAKIIEVLTRPVRMVILEYPGKVVNRGLRSKQRVTCRIPANIFQGIFKESVIEDLSTAGCRISAVYQPAEKNYIARPGDSLKVTCRIPTAANEISMTGTIRNAAKKTLNLTYGVEFQDISPESESVIESYISTLIY